MAIEQYGESILADVRQRKRERERRLEKDDLTGALAGLGVTIGYKVGNQVLANNMRTFLNNERILSATAQQKAALSGQAEIYALRDEITKSGISDTMFFENKNMPEFEARAIETLSPEQASDISKYEELKRAKVREFAEAQAEAYRKAVSAADRLADEDSFESMVALNARDAKASNILTAGARGLSRFFTGKSALELEEEAIDAIANGRMAENTKQFQIFMDQYRETRDMVGSMKTAEFATTIPPLTDEDRYLIVPEQSIDTISGKPTIVTKNTRYDRVTGKIVGVSYDSASVDDITKASEDARDEELLADYRAGFNMSKDPQRQLNDDALVLFHNQLKEKEIDPLLIDTAEQWRTAAEVFRKLLSNRDNWRDTAEAEIRASMFEKAYEYSLDSLNIPVDIRSSNPAVRQRAYERMFQLRQELYESILNLSRKQTATSSSGT